MNEHIEPQIILKDGKPAFAVIPWDKYQELIKNRIEVDDSELEIKTGTI
jgi:hypothetical protein